MKKNKSKTFKVILLVLLIVLLIAYYIIDSRIYPVLGSICEVRARIIATQAINNAIKTELQKDDLKEQLIVTIYDSEGKISMISTNANVMNKLSANITSTVQDALKSLTKQPFSIQLGSVINNWLFPNFGPKLKYSIIPQGSVLVDFITEFEESGINQTRYKIFITVGVNIRVISPVVTQETYVISITKNKIIKEYKSLIITAL